MPLKQPVYDSCELMKALARMANVEWGRFRKMVLVLEPDAMPVLYGELQLCTSDEQLPEVTLHVQECPAPQPSVEGQLKLRS